ncbi:MAG: hypothetical protein PW734_12385 [Verrucomicrobium sp.]|nr:hypothetical protein [Verrucomicrobium sp.]
MEFPLLNPENEAATAELEALAQELNEGLAPLESYPTEGALLRGRGDDFFHRQAEKLIAASTQHHRLLPGDAFQDRDRISFDTGEVLVYPDGDRVAKVTKYKYDKGTQQQIDYFGLAAFCDHADTVHPFATVVHASPGQYLARLALSNRVFGDDNRFEGVLVDRHGHPHIATSQHYFNSKDSWTLSREEADRFMEERGFLHPPGSWGWHQYLPQEGIVAVDFKAANFMRRENGQPFPIDLILSRVDPQKFKDWGWEKKAPEPPRLADMFAGITLPTHKMAFPEKAGHER